MYIPYQFLTAMEEDRLRRPVRRPRRVRVFRSLGRLTGSGGARR
jgi:hypothetical protein